MDRAVTFGKEGGFRAVLQWTGPTVGTAAEVTRGELLIEVGDTVVWSGESIADGFEWTWIELLEFLAHNWPWLEREQSLPFGMQGTAADLRRKLDLRWNELPTTERVIEEKSALAFHWSHNLSSAVQGAWPEPLWILRRGRLCEIDACGQTWLLPIDDVLGTLRQLGDIIAERAHFAGDVRAHSALDLWRDGPSVSENLLLQAESGWTADYIAAMGGHDEVAQLFNWSRASEDTAQLAAARMAGTDVDPEDQWRIASAIAKVLALSTPILDHWSAQLLDFHAIADPLRAFAIGRDAAAAFRALLGKEQVRIDPRELLETAGVRVDWLVLKSRQLDAVATWGGEHGPAVLFASKSARNKSSAGLRATLAHEIAHLLLDRDGALPLAEVLGGEAAPGVEPRANAFAAELLVPRAAIRASFDAGVDVKAVHRSLCQQFGASRELVAWQIRRAEVPLSGVETAYLRQFVGNPWAF